MIIILIYDWLLIFFLWLIISPVTWWFDDRSQLNCQQLDNSSSLHCQINNRWIINPITNSSPNGYSGFDDVTAARWNPSSPSLSVSKHWLKSLKIVFHCFKSRVGKVRPAGQRAYCGPYTSCGPRARLGLAPALNDRND